MSTAHSLICNKRAEPEADNEEQTKSRKLQFLRNRLEIMPNCKLSLFFRLPIVCKVKCYMFPTVAKPNK